MGLEAKCAGKIAGGEVVVGKLHVDSKRIAFSGAGKKWAIELGEGVKTRIEGDWLIVSRGREKGAFEVGEAAQKWAKKILSPPSRLTKLGVKPAMRVWMKGKFPADFEKELASAGAERVRSIEKAEMVFLLLETKADLPKIAEVSQKLVGKTPLWLVWAKGQPTFRESDVMGFAAECEIGPSKNCAFDERLTAEKYYRKG
jgi:hypothetical protein